MTRLTWERPTVTPVSPLAALARLQAGTSDTPIHDQLVVQLAVRKLGQDLQPVLENVRRAMAQLGQGMATFAARVRQAEAERAARMAPEAVLDRIRQDQAALDWRDQWRAERGQL